MAEGRAIGTVFIELDLDPSRYTKGQQQLLKDATSASLNIEENFKKLGVKSSAEMDLMRAKIINSFDMIANSSKATANDILRAEEAKNRQLAALDEQQFGKQTMRMSALKEHWLAISGVIIAGWMAVGKAMEFVELGAKAQQAEESFRMVAESSKIASDALIENLKRAAAGTVDDSDIMQRAVKGMILGLNDRQLVTIMENARLAARYAGVDVKTAFEDITNAIGTDMPRALRQYGLITREESRQVQAALAAGAEDISLYDLAMAHAAVNSAKFAEAQMNAAEAVQTFKAVINEIKEAIGKLTIATAQYLLAGAEGLNAFATRGVAGLMALLGREEAYRNLLAASNEMLRKRNALLGIQTPEEKAAAETAKEKAKSTLAEAEAALKREQARVAGAAEAAKAMKQQEEELKKIREQQREGDLASAGAHADEIQALFNAAAKADVVRIDAANKIREANREKDIDSAGVYADEVQALFNATAKAEVAQSDESWKIREKNREADLESVKAHAEEVQALFDAAARGDVKRIDEGLKLAKEAADASRKEFTDIFASISNAVSTSIKGIIMGTQTMEQAFRRMGESIALSLMDSIVNRGLKQVENALADFLFTSGGGILGTLLGGLGGFFAPTAAFAAPANPVPVGFFQEGGTVPGPIGMPRFAVVHGGEEIRRPGQRRGESGTTVQQVFNLSPGVPEAVRREVWAMMPVIEQRTVAAVVTARNRGGEVASAVGARRR